jgi:PKD repeat protein
MFRLGNDMSTIRYFLFLFSVVLCFGVVSAAPSPPVANFTANITYGVAPLAVRFTDLSLNNASGWAWFYGDETYTQEWTQVNSGTGWTARFGHCSVAMADGITIVLMGGSDSGDDYKNDTWRSTNNGATWTQVNASSGWTARQSHTCVALLDGSIVLMGGSGIGSYKNDTWLSTDKGATWTQQTARAGWSARRDHSSVVMPDGSIVLIGGIGNSGRNNDTWWSTDNGTTWKRVNASSGWTKRELHSSVAMPDGSIVLTGGWDGGYKNDTWLSINNGTTWTQVNVSSGWSARDEHSSVAMPDGSIVLMGGGYNVAPYYLNDTWRSTNHGVTWTQLPYAGWSARYAISSVVMRDGSIVLTGGYDILSGHKNDTWRFRPAGSPIKNPVHIYTTPGIYTVALQAFNAGGYNSIRKAGYITVTNPMVRKIGVFRNSTHVFYLDYNGNGVWNGASVDRQYNFGISGDIPISGDWNLDGRTEIGVFRNSTHLFYLDYNGNGIWNGAVTDRQYNFGLSGDIPVTGDWNNDGKTEIGVFRPSTHMFYLDYNGNGAWNGATIDKQYNFGLNGDIPVTGDWNTDGRTDIGVFRNSTHLFYLDFNGNGVWNGATIDKQYNFGLTGDIPVSGDWSSDGRTEIGVFRPSTHMFYLDYNGNGAWNGAMTDRSFNFGMTGDKPITGSWS